MMKHLVFACFTGEEKSRDNHRSVKAFLDQVMKAKEMKIDK
jgi:hypothetical protein